MSTRRHHQQASLRPSPTPTPGVDNGATMATTNGRKIGPSDPVREASALVTFTVPESLVEAIALRAAEMVVGHLAQPESWIGVQEAAEHIGSKASRIYREVSRAKPGGWDPNPIPYAKDGQRLLFRRSELDAWLARGGHREE